eukprot:1139584-Pelagomonas_calceolata.AAC.6
MQIRGLSGKQEWSAGGLQSSQKGPPPGPGTSRGIHLSMLMKFFLSGAVPGAWMGATGQLLSAAKHNDSSCRFAPCTGRHQNLDFLVNFLAGPA